MLTTLTLVYALNFIDRTIVSIIGQPMKESLGITDNQLGLLGGLAFALLYTILGVPIARLAERVSRVNIIAVCITMWSGFTALCGVAPNFAVMLAMRVGVGIGEAGCSPPAHSLISRLLRAASAAPRRCRSTRSASRSAPCWGRSSAA